MKQVFQDLESGATLLSDVPAPGVGAGHLTVATQASLISAGTERMLVDFGRASLIQKARSQPDKVRQVIDKIRTDGIAATMESVRAKLSMPFPLGYCQAGIVLEVGSGVADMRPGDRVATNGPHAEIVRVPRLLAARIPDGVSFEEAAFVPVGSVALHGVRLAEVTLGECVVVVGLGLIGLLTVQVLRASGCRVLGVDRDSARLALGEQLGAEPVSADRVVDDVMARTDGVGADAVLLTLASDSNEPIAQAAAMSRRKGRIILVGVTGLRLSRDVFFKKELRFSVSSSYGPGRYDPSYEQFGQDYPLPYVRWTENRNFAAVLRMMADGALKVGPLITHRLPFAEAPTAYDIITSPAPGIGVVLQYPSRSMVTAQGAPRAERSVQHRVAAGGRPSLGLIGAGAFAVRTLLPALRRSGARLHTVASEGGASAGIVAGKFGFERSTTVVDEVLENPEIDAVVIATRHDSHADLTARALRAGKSVLVEKPLALTEEQLRTVEDAHGATGGSLLVGFNRRYAPLTRALLERIGDRRSPIAVQILINAGTIPSEHWTQRHDVGGGRIIGEACHFVDLARALVGHPITGVQGACAQTADGSPISDVASSVLTFQDGSIATLSYLANGSVTFPKERVEVFASGRVYQIDNWRRLRVFGGGPRISVPRAQDKGHQDEVGGWVASLRGERASLTPAEEQFEVSRWTLALANAMRRSPANG